VAGVLVTGGRDGCAMCVRHPRVQGGRPEADGRNRSQQAPACESLVQGAIGHPKGLWHN
jgi:hypothetical protein